MKSKTAPEFWKKYGKLPQHIQTLADKNYQHFIADPQHPSLNFKHLTGVFWSVCIGDHYRAVCRRNGDTVMWIWIDTHEKYNHLF
jgi:hypothetical protein